MKIATSWLQFATGFLILLVCLNGCAGYDDSTLKDEHAGVARPVDSLTSTPRSSTPQDDEQPQSSVAVDTAPETRSSSDASLAGLQNGAARCGAVAGQGDVRHVVVAGGEEGVPCSEAIDVAAEYLGAWRDNAGTYSAWECRKNGKEPFTEKCVNGERVIELYTRTR